MRTSYLKAEKACKIQEVLTTNFGGASCADVWAIWECDYTSLEQMAKDFKVHINQLNLILSEGANKNLKLEKMKTISLDVYSFDELNEDTKQVAIENIRESYYEHNDFAEWVVDDCSLLEPPHDELIKLFGENYNFPLIENKRGGIYFSTDRNWYLDCADAMNITNDRQFLLWLGIDNTLEGLEDVSFSIYTPSGRNSDTTIEFEDFDERFDDLIEEAEKKFDSHVEDILRRIEGDIEYRYTDEAIIEDISANDKEFLETGEVYN